MTLLAFFPFPPKPSGDMVLEAFLVGIGVVLWAGLSYCLWWLDTLSRRAEQ